MIQMNVVDLNTKYILRYSQFLEDYDLSFIKSMWCIGSMSIKMSQYT
jgi:hypothetical protein